jgi:hypothetical protein
MRPFSSRSALGADHGGRPAAEVSDRAGAPARQEERAGTAAPNVPLPGVDGQVAGAAPDTERAAREIGPLYAPLERAVTELMETYCDRDLAVLVDFAGKANRIAHDHTARLRAEVAAAKRSREAVPTPG